MVNRIIRDDPSKGDMHNRQALSFSLFWEAIKDYDMWPIYLLGVTWSLPEIPSNSYITLIIESLGFDTFQTNLLTVPGYVLFIIQLVVWTWMSEKINNRFGIVLVCQLWMLPILIALEVLPPSAAYTWARYALNIMLVGFPYIHPILGECRLFTAGGWRNWVIDTNSGYDVSQRGFCPYTDCGNRIVQHVRTGVEYHCCKRTYTLSITPMYSLSTIYRGG